MRCPGCATENSEDRTYCSACGTTLVGGQPSHFSKEFFQFFGVIGDVCASLDLMIQDQFYATGKLRVDTSPPTDVLGLINNGVLTLEMANTVIDVPIEGKDYEIPVRMIPALVGKFDGSTFVGEATPEDGDVITTFRFVARQHQRRNHEDHPA